MSVCILFSCDLATMQLWQSQCPSVLACVRSRKTYNVTEYIHLWDQRPHKGQPEVNLSRNMQMSWLICKDAIIQQPKYIGKSNLVKRTLDQSVIHLWGQRSYIGQPGVNLSRNGIWLPNLIRTLDQRVIYIVGSRSRKVQPEVSLIAAS